VRTAGLEPTTPGFGSRCSVPLSYVRACGSRSRSRTPISSFRGWRVAGYTIREGAGGPASDRTGKTTNASVSPEAVRRVEIGCDLALRADVLLETPRVPAEPGMDGRRSGGRSRTRRSATSQASLVGGHAESALIAHPFAARARRRHRSFCSRSGLTSSMSRGFSRSCRAATQPNRP
jgi:hypothetical protein